MKITLLTGAAVATLLAAPLGAVRFYADDPLWKEPPPKPVGKVEVQKLDNFSDFYKNTVHTKGERHSPGHIYPSRDPNTLGEVPDNAWYTNRHGQGRMSLVDLVRGPDRVGPPNTSKPWTILSAKAEGVTPGFVIKDGAGRRYLLKFDPKTNNELATAADSVGSKFFYAFGYNVPENYPVRFSREQLTINEGLQFTDKLGRKRHLRAEDLDDLLATVGRYPDGAIRGLASFFIPGQPVGPFKYYKRRADDPNELASHEHLRVLRGLYVFAAWMNHTDAKSLNSLDVVTEEKGIKFVKHYLIDFGASLGSDSLYAKDPRLGHDYFLDPQSGAIQLLSLGFYVPAYARIHYSKNPAVGNFNSTLFEPDHWKSNYPNAAFANRLAGDEFWAARQIMAFTEEEIRAMVKTGLYSDPQSVETITKILTERRDKIGREYLTRLLPLDNFAVKQDRLTFTDLAAHYRIRPAAEYTITWASFDNARDKQNPLPAATGPVLPPAARNAAPGTYWAATVRGGQPAKSITVYLRKTASGWIVAGLDREGENDWRPVS